MQLALVGWMLLQLLRLRLLVLQLQCLLLRSSQCPPRLQLQVLLLRGPLL